MEKTKTSGVEKIRLTANSTDMTKGDPARLILFFALPLMLGNILQQTYTMVDTVVVGHVIGFQALAAVGAADWINWLVLGSVIGLCQGFSILVAQQFGAEDYPAVRRTVAMSVLLSAVVSILFMVVFFPLAKPILRLLRTPSGIMDSSLTFLYILLGGIPVITGYNVFASVLRSMGNSRAPLAATGIASAINIALDIVFVVLLRWGVAGAAAATVIAQAFSCLFCLKALSRIPFLHLSRDDWIPDWDLIKRLVLLGAPMAVQNAVIGVGSMVVQAVVNGFGVIFVAGYTAVMKLYGLLELAATSFGFSMVAYTGQNLGAKKYGRIRKGMKAGLKMSICVAGLISVVILSLGKQIVRVFVSGNEQDVEAVVDVAYHYLFLMGIFLFVLYMLYLYRSALQGMGDTVVPMISGIVELAMRVGCVLALPLLVGRGGVYFAEVAAWLGSAVLLMVTYYRRMRGMPREEDAPPE